MRPLAATLLTPEQLLTFERVRSFVSTLADGLTCHEVCAAVAREYPALRHARGVFADFWEHSWLVYPDEFVILDPYPWALASGPILAHVCLGSPWRSLYSER